MSDRGLNVTASLSTPEKEVIVIDDYVDNESWRALHGNGRTPGKAPARWHGIFPLHWMLARGQPETVVLAILEAYPAAAADEIGFTRASFLYIR